MGKKTNILHVSSSFFSGGIESYLLNFFTNADNDRFEHFLFVGRDDGQLREHYHRLPIRIKELKCTPKHFFYSLPYGSLFCGRHGIDIIHGHNYWFYRYAYALSLLTGIPLVTSNYGLGLWKKRRHLLLESMIFRRAKVNIAISRTILEKEKSLVRRAADDPGKFRLVYPIINEAPMQNLAAYDAASTRRRIGIDNAGPVFTIVGRIDPLKGHRLAIDAMERINRDGLRANLLIIGARGDASILRETDLRRGDVTYLNYYEPIEEIWAVSDYFLIPSLSEGTPLVLVEYLALGKPIIASDISGNSELVRDGWNGYLFKTGDADDLARKIGHVMAAGDLRDVRANAREFYARNLSPRALTREIERAYLDVV